MQPNTSSALAYPRLYEKIELSEVGCWLWSGSLGGNPPRPQVWNYIYPVLGGRIVGAARLIYTLEVGTIPSGLVLKRTCTVDKSRCVNPGHHVPVTRKTLQQMSPDTNATKVFCKRGHSLRSVDDPNVRITSSGHRVIDRPE